jgi:hypothetical protein
MGGDHMEGRFLPGAARARFQKIDPPMAPIMSLRARRGNPPIDPL